jgi:hypothetical protein
MKRIFNWILGVILLPFLYGRYGILVVAPLVFWLFQADQGWKEHDINMFEVMGAFYFMWIVFYGVLFGNCRVMNSWTKMWHKILGIEYTYKGQWTTDMMHSFSVWTHPKIEMKGKEYNFSYARMGGNLYDWEANMRRTLILKWLFS